jgi:hypothetical protein
VITYPDRGNPGLGRMVNAPASAASGVVEDCAAMRFAGTAHGRHFPRRESLTAVDGRAEIR